MKLRTKRTERKDLKTLIETRIEEMTLIKWRSLKTKSILKTKKIQITKKRIKVKKVTKMTQKSHSLKNLKRKILKPSTTNSI